MTLDLEKEGLIAHQLELRQSRAPGLAAERKVFRQIAGCMSDGPEHVLKLLCDTAIRICNAGSSGVSMLRTVDSGENYRGSNDRGSNDRGRTIERTIEGQF